METLHSKSIYYKDVNLIAQPNFTLQSRKEVPEKDKYRIIVSPMPSIIGETFIEVALELGLTVVIDRFRSIGEQVKLAKVFGKYPNAYFSVGLWSEGRVYALLPYTNNFCIDVANAYLDSTVQFTDSLYNILNNANTYNIIVGNIHSSAGVELYKNFALHGGRLLLRCGIGNGAACDTATKATGFGRGQITEIEECSQAAKKYNFDIIADGGISNGACAAKAFGAGAQYIMLGSYFSYAEEAQNIIDGEYKFWGCASTYNQAKFGKVWRHSEGKVIEIDKSQIKPLKTLVDELWGGISSAVSYSGYKTLPEFIGNGVFELKYSS